MSGNRSASWATPGHATQKAVSVRCPSCGWKTRRTKDNAGWAVYGVCKRRCTYGVGLGDLRLVELQPVPTLAEKRAEKAKAELSGLKGGKDR